MRSIGFPVFAYKLGAFTLAGTLGGLAGYLAACQFGFVNPEILAWHQSGTVLMMVILGGMGRLHGAVIGAAAYVLLQELFSSSALFGAYAKHWQLSMGALIVIIVLALPHGVGGVIDVAWRRRGYRQDGNDGGRRWLTRSCKRVISPNTSAAWPRSMTYRWRFVPASCMRLIGPNGAGKSTLINLLSGELRATAGQILFQGREIGRLAPEQRSRLGIGRSFQKTNIFPSFTALENCRLAVQSRQPRPLAWWRDALSYDSVMLKAREALAAVSLSERADDFAFALSHGEQRQLEIAMCLATEPQLLLLDEPLAGMGTDESLRMIELIKKLSAAHAVLLVEHDMDAVFQLAQVLTVMVDGRASRHPARRQEIRADREVQAAYLGATESRP